MQNTYLHSDQLQALRLGKPLFAPVSFTLAPGEILHVEGDNGIGKTTLLRTLCGLHTLMRGKVLWQEDSKPSKAPEGRQVKGDMGVLSICRPDQAAQQLGRGSGNNPCYIGHEPGVRLDLTVLENWQAWENVYASDSSCSPLEGEPAAQPPKGGNLMRDLDLAHKQHKLCRHLSAGQRRKVALARLLISRAAVWILDEPFVALDTKGMTWLIERIQQHVSAGGAVILTSHQTLPRMNANVKQLDLVTCRSAQQ